MKKLILFVTAILLTTGLFAQEKFIVPEVTIERLDLDGDSFNWYYGVRTANEVAEGAMRSESWDSAGEQALTPDNWLFTPSITLVEPVIEPAAVTFNVDMTYAEGFDPASDIVYLTGSILGWAEPGTDPDNQTMSRVGETMIWTKTLELEAGSYEYKYFLNAGWDGGEWDGGDNRTLIVEGDMEVNDWFGYLTDPTSVPEVDAADKHQTMLVQLDAIVTVSISYAKEQGLTATEYGTLIGEQFKYSWNKDAGFYGSVKGMLYNMSCFLAEPDIEITTNTAEKVEFKTRLMGARIKKDEPVYGVTYKEYMDFFKAVMNTIGDYLGAKYEISYDEEWMYFTVSKI